MDEYSKVFKSRYFKFFKPIKKYLEKKYIKKYGSMPLKHQPIFIIGAPRTGSTILYQTITNQLDVLYIDNLVAKFYQNFFAGFWLSNKFFKQEAHNCFTSVHGNTEGLHSPSECGAFWYRWLPKDRHFIDYDDITSEMVEQIREEITAVINYFDKPLIFKNLNAGQRLRLLKQCFPEAKFIFIKRNPFMTAQSILQAKRKLDLHANQFWSIMPKNVNYLRQLDGYEQIVKQIYFLEKQIIEDSQLFNRANFFTLNYNSFCHDFKTTMSEIKKFIGVDERCNFIKTEIYSREKCSLNSKEFTLFEQEIKKLDWNNYSDE